jgi:hypothetical protein
MDNVIDAATSFFNGLAVGDGTANESDLLSDFCEIRLFAGREVVEHGDGMATAYQFVHRIRADKTGASSDQIAHQKNPPKSAPHHEIDMRLIFWAEATNLQPTYAYRTLPLTSKRTGNYARVAALSQTLLPCDCPALNKMGGERAGTTRHFEQAKYT